MGDIYDKVATTLTDFTTDADRYGNQAIKTLATEIDLTAPPAFEENINTLLALVTDTGLDIPDDFPTAFDPGDPSFQSPAALGSVAERGTSGNKLDDVDFNNQFGTFNATTTAIRPDDAPVVTFSDDAPTVIVPDLKDAPEVNDPLEVLLNTGRTYLIPDVELLPIEVAFPDNPTLRTPSALDYHEDSYTPEFINEALTQARSVLGGRTITPAWVWNGIWSRAAGNLHRQERAAVRQAQHEHAARGWMLPGVTLLAREADARQKTADAISELSRENATQQAQMVREDLWKALETGLACEKLLFEFDNAYHERALKAAVETVNSAVSVYTAMAQTHNALVQAALGKAQTLKMAMEVRLMAYEKTKLELQIGTLETEQDKRKVELFEAEWKGELTKVQAYAAWAEAVKSYVEAQKANVEAFGLEVQAKQGIVQAWATEWQVYGQHKLEPARIQISAQQAENGLFAQSIAHWQTAIQQKRTKFDADLELRKYELSYDSLDVERYKAESANFDMLNRASVAYTQAMVQVYQALSQANLGKMGIDIEAVKARIAGAAQGADAAAKAGQIAVEQYKAQVGLAVQHMGAQASVLAQLGSAAYSAANISLGASSSYNNSYSKSESESVSTNYNWSGELKPKTV